MLLFSKASPHMSGKLTIKGEGARPAKGPHLRRWHLLAVALPLLHPRLHMRGHVCRLPVSLHSLGMVCLNTKTLQPDSFSEPQEHNQF